MKISLKCQYAIRGVLELARQHGHGVVPISDIAKVYGVSARFLEVILNELKQGGFVGSKRGARGGFYLARHPRDLTVGDIVRFIDGPLNPVVKCVVGRGGHRCPRMEGCSLRGLWDQAKQTVEGIYDSATFESLVERETPAGAPAYVI